MASGAAPGERIRRLWDRLSPLPGGRRVFSWIIGRITPYSGTMGAVVTELEPGRCVARLQDRRKVRNHLGSVHAVALANLGELTTGLAVMGAMPPSVRGIVVALEVTYQEKARGTLVAEARCPIPRVRERTEHRVRSSIRNSEGREVARVEATWLLDTAEAPSRGEG